MTDDMQRARELLAAEYEWAGEIESAQIIRTDPEFWQYGLALRAITAALRAAPEGFAMVPVEPTEEMYGAATARVKANSVDWNGGTLVRDPIAHTWAAMIAARPQGVKDAT